MIEDFLLNFRGERLYVRRVYSDSVEIPIANLRVYALRLKSKNDVIMTSDDRLLKKLYATKSPRGTKILFTVLIRNKVNSFYRTEIFFLSFSKNLLDVLKTEIGDNNVDTLSGFEISNLLFRMLNIRTSIDLDTYSGEIRPLETFFSTTTDVEKRFRIMAAEVSEGDVKCFMGGNYIGTDTTQYEKIYSLPFTGVIYICLSLEDQTDPVKRKLQQSLSNRAGIVDIKEKIEKREVDFGGVSVCFFTTDPELSYLVTLFSGLGFVPLEKRYGRKYMILNTPIMVRDPDYIFQIPLEDLIYYIPLSCSKSYLPKKILMYGKNRYGDYVGFNNFEEGNNPHIMLFAPSGAGKSFFLQNCISQIMRIDIESIFKGTGYPKLTEGVLIRHFDKGFSAELLYKLLKHRGYNVDIMSPRISEMAYNICEVDIEEDYEFSLGLANSILDVLEQETLSGLEKVFYLKALKDIYLRPDEYISLRKQQIGKLPHIIMNDTISEVYDKLRARGYKDEDLIENIKEREYDFLKKATLIDVIRVLSLSRDMTLTKTEKESLDKTITKLEILSSYDLIRRPASFDFKNVDIFYFDYEFLFTHTFFTPLFLAMMKKLIFADKFYKKEDDVAFYFIDEAHNLFRKPVFAELLNILIREARKYRISLVFATQNFGDIPPEVIMNTDTKMLLTPQEFTQKRAYLKDLAKHINIDLDKENVSKVFYNMPLRQLTVWYSEGVFGLFLNVDEYKLKLFDSYRKTLQLPDGTELKKSNVI